MLKRLKEERGFTLIELLVVMTIIAILAVAMAVAFLNTSKSARDTRRKADLRNLATKAEEYFKDKGGYPAALTDLTTAGYLTTIPADPKASQSYTYTPAPASCAAGACTSFSIAATCENANDKDCTGTPAKFTVVNAQ